jgi:tetratricopeptide (TPR) repeat protein
VGYLPTLAEILFVAGTLQQDAAHIDGALGTIEDALWTAEHARHDEIAASAASHLVYLAGYMGARFELGEIWSRHTETLLRRMGGHDQIWGWYFNNRAAMRELQGRLGDAIDDARLAVAAKERALGPDAPDLALSMSNLANHLVCCCELESGLAASQRALDILTAGLGSDHPRTAIILANHGQILCRLERFEEARTAVLTALRIFERETDPNGMWVTYPLRTLGLCHLGERRFDEAERALERAVAIRDAVEKRPLRLAEVHFPLARALDEGRGDRPRALALAHQARREYAQAPATPIVARDLAELDRWLAARA